MAQNETGGANRRFWSMFPLAGVPFWYRFFEPQPNVNGVSGISQKMCREGLRALCELAKVHDGSVLVCRISAASNCQISFFRESITTGSMFCLGGFKENGGT